MKISMIKTQHKSYKKRYHVKLNNDLHVSFTSKKKAKKFQSKINKSIELCFVKQNRTLESAIKIYNSYQQYIEVSTLLWINEDLSAYYNRYTRLRLLINSENYNSWLFSCFQFRSQFINQLIEVLTDISIKRSEKQNRQLLKILTQENFRNNITAAFNSGKQEKQIIKILAS